MSKWDQYQAMSTIAKKVGGPLPFVGIIALSGYGIGRVVEAGVKKCRQTLKDYSSPNENAVVLIEENDIESQGEDDI